MEERKYRLFILGAGFSKPAGLPLANELWQKILTRSKYFHSNQRASKFNDDIDTYISYRRDCDGIELTKETINFEEFLGFLDIEHYLGLRGSDTWSEDGNEGQIVIKHLIGNLLTQYMPSSNKIPELYLEFARRLQPNDYILTFNYDILLERALDAVGKPYRLFPTRYESLSEHYNTTDSSKEEIIILKLHGSIDWFDKSQYLKSKQYFEKQGTKILPHHPIFNSTKDWGISKLLDGPRQDDDPLLNMHRISNIKDFYEQDILFTATPWMLSPSTNKIIYANSLKEFWYGLGNSGGYNFSMAIIGYSLPQHDLYAKQVIYSLIKNYQETNILESDIFGGRTKAPLVLVDYRTTKESILDFQNNYRFIDFNNAELYMDGFNIEVLDKIFS